jgi:hypothetical protein
LDSYRKEEKPGRDYRWLTKFATNAGPARQLNALRTAIFGMMTQAIGFVGRGARTDRAHTG